MPSETTYRAVLRDGISSLQVPPTFQEKANGGQLLMLEEIQKNILPMELQMLAKLTSELGSEFILKRVFLFLPAQKLILLN